MSTYILLTAIYAFDGGTMVNDLNEYNSFGTFAFLLRLLTHAVLFAQ